MMFLKQFHPKPAQQQSSTSSVAGNNSNNNRHELSGISPTGSGGSGCSSEISLNPSELDITNEPTGSSDSGDHNNNNEHNNDNDSNNDHTKSPTRREQEKAAGYNHLQQLKKRASMIQKKNSDIINHPTAVVAAAIVNNNNNNNNNNITATTYYDSCCSSSNPGGSTTSDSGTDMLNGTFETIPVSSLVPENATILERMSFDEIRRDEEDAGDDSDETDYNQNHNLRHPAAISQSTVSNGEATDDDLYEGGSITGSSVITVTTASNPQQGDDGEGTEVDVGNRNRKNSNSLISEQHDNNHNENYREDSRTDSQQQTTIQQQLSTILQDQGSFLHDYPPSVDAVAAASSGVSTAGAVIEEGESICTASNKINQSQQQQQSTTEPDFVMGDHVYQWCSFAGIPYAFQHHGIVMDVYWCPMENAWILKIVDFSNWDLQQEKSTKKDSVARRKKSLTKSNCPNGGCVRTYESIVNDKDDRWYKVEYRADWWKRHTWRSGSCTAAACDSPGLVRSRVEFLLKHADLLPPYSAVKSNCECVAVWCKTGNWCTLQASSWLYVTAASQAKQAATLAGVASAATVTVPASGMWGFLGYTTTTSLTAAQPLLLPAIAAYGVVTTAGPALWLLSAKHHWNKLTETLNSAFWEEAIHNPEIFVESITYWSTTGGNDVTKTNIVISDSPTTTKTD